MAVYFQDCMGHAGVLYGKNSEFLVLSLMECKFKARF